MERTARAVGLTIGVSVHILLIERIMGGSSAVGIRLREAALLGITALLRETALLGIAALLRETALLGVAALLRVTGLLGVAALLRIASLLRITALTDTGETACSSLLSLCGLLVQELGAAILCGIG